ncbi:hypothetical protein [Streptomyces djakartensis]|uniref:hypothetical protein n=1 Tax=Streptomyces djakartensis TaxID=68193 RepID=UPI0034DEAAE8
MPAGGGGRAPGRSGGCFDLDSPMGRQAYDGMGKGWPQVLHRLESVLGDTP